MAAFKAKPSKQAHITIKDLTMAYGDFVIMRDLSYTINRGDVFIIMGGSGCGKSTMMTILIGLKSPAKGKVFYGDVDFWESDHDVRHQIIRRSGVMYQSGALIVELKDFGVTLLLFTIGLKLRLSSLAKPEVWAGTTIHALITVIVFGAGIYLLSAANLPLFNTLDFRLSLLIAFALSFSSTVFAVKVLESKAEMSALHGRVAIGILIMQDILAVIFITASTGKLPSTDNLVDCRALVHSNRATLAFRHS